jgi:Tfp pilus assembly PilM family ATPase
MSLRKNLIDSLDKTIEEAGLKSSVVNVEFAE